MIGAGKVIIIGASSGIGLELAKLYSNEGWIVGIASRRPDRLKEIADSLPGESRVQKLDIARPEHAVRRLNRMVEDMGGLDVLIVSAGVDYFNSDLKWEEIKDTIDINVSGFSAVVNEAFQYFVRQGHGSIAGISSVAALRGSAAHPAYSASKAYVSNYLEGLRLIARRENLNVTVCDVKPGNVDTPMSEGQEDRFWIATAQEAASEIIRAVEKEKRIVYVTARWKWIALLMRHLPEWLYAKF